MLTLLLLGVAGVMEMTVLRKAGAGEGVLASSWMTGMILLVVRRVEWSLSSSTEVTRPDSGARDPWQPEPDKYWEWSLQANDKLGVGFWGKKYEASGCSDLKKEFLLLAVRTVESQA